MNSSAVIVGNYRYHLSRSWLDGPHCLFIMLNPSTADALFDDPTIRRCVGFARAWGFAGLSVVNLYAWRATNPDELLVARDPIGRDNDHYIESWCTMAGRMVAAWGAKADPGRAAVVATMARRHGELWCLGKTKDGRPRHPLYVPASKTLEPY